MSKRDRRVAARTKATTPSAAPPAEQAHDTAPTAPPPQPQPVDSDTPLAKVIPLGIFDPFAEADKRW